MFKRNRFANSPALARGATLLDVLLGILIFVVGMLALASMQGNLTRSSTDAKARTVGTNIAEEIIEGVRTFDTIRDDACPNTLAAIIAENAYQCVTSVADTTISRGGLDYQVDVTVDDYYQYFNNDGETVVTKDTGDLPSNRDTTISDFKYVEIDVNWGNSTTDFVTYNEQNPTAGLGSGSFTLSSIIPSSPPLGPAKVAEAEEEAGTLPVSYAPGRRPYNIRVDLNSSDPSSDKFKETLTPEIADENSGSLKTWLDVVTYNQGDSSIYQRRDEFLVISCGCKLKAANPGTPTGYLPTVWNGATWVTGNDGKMVSKNYGVPAGNISQYCETCCRDHHDPDQNNPSDDELYDPVSGSKPKWSESGGPNNDHRHYTRNNKGVLTEVVPNSNSEYVEVCRMVRKDGFMRVAQDFRQEGFAGFPAGYLDTRNGADEYADYVIEAMQDFYVSDQDRVSPPCDLGYDFPGDQTRLDCANALLDVTDTTTLPLDGLNQQQMRSRGLYIENQSAALVKLLDCVKEKDQTMKDPAAWNACGAPGVDDPLQVLPFFEVETTSLSDWNSEPQENPLKLDAKTKGLAVLTNASATETVHVTNDMHRGNTGLLSAFTAITVADSTEPDAQSVADLFVDIGGGDDGIPPPITSYTWTGTFNSGVPQVEAFATTIDPIGNEYCAKHDRDQLTCTAPINTPGSINITGYSKMDNSGNWMPLWICLSGPPAGMTVSNTADGLNNSAVLKWEALPNGTTGFTISIEESECS